MRCGDDDDDYMDEWLNTCDSTGEVHQLTDKPCDNPVHHRIGFRIPKAGFQSRADEIRRQRGL